MATAFFHALNVPVRIDYVEMPESLRGKYRNFTQADMGKLHDAGCTNPFHSLEDAVADYVETYPKKVE